MDNRLTAKHGLSLYIEVNGKKIIFDTGPDDTFIKNANKLGISVKEVDYLIISHGHIDHGGGLKAFLEVNQDAKIIVSKKAYGMFYTKILGLLKIYIGLKDKPQSSRVIFSEDLEEVEGVGKLISRVNGELCPSSINKSLYMEEDRVLKLDNFKHEISLLINEEGKTILISGCSHKGIINILEAILETEESLPNVVFGGMHLCNPITKKTESDAYIMNMSKLLERYRIDKIYTYHCTGKYPYEKMKEILGDRLVHISTGQEVIVTK